MPRTIFFLILTLLLSTQESIYSQRHFDKEVLEIQNKYDTLWDASRETIVFTGSSSIRMWVNLQESFPNQQIVNTGFGGSEATDLLEYLSELVLNFKPYKVFIYEGDNDINQGKTKKEIVTVTKNIIAHIKDSYPQAEIVLISAKPSIARWKLRKKYQRFNKQLAKLSKNNKEIYFADVWNPMVNKKKLNKELFIEDDLHMNSKGYDLWYNVIKNFIN